MKKGKFIVIDGIEGAGKTTLVRKLSEEFSGKVAYLREPGGSIFAEKLRELILSDAAEDLSDEARFMLFWASRIDFVEKVLQPALCKYDLVISDRFDSSTYAYQVFSSANKELESLFWKTREIVLDSVQPDMYIILDLDPVLALKRVESRGKLNYFDKQDLDFHHKIREGFLNFIKKLEGVALTVDASKPKEEVKKEVQKIITLKGRLEFNMDLL